MALINPQLVALAIVANAGNASAYVVANGFQTGTPTGATAGSAAIDRIAAGNYVLYLDEEEEFGSLTSQGGLVIDVISSKRQGVPTIAFATVSHGDVTGEGAAWAGVSAKRKVHVRFYDATGALAEPDEFTVKVWRNPLTLYT